MAKVGWTCPPHGDNLGQMPFLIVIVCVFFISSLLILIKRILFLNFNRGAKYMSCPLIIINRGQLPPLPPLPARLCLDRATAHQRRDQRRVSDERRGTDLQQSYDVQSNARHGPTADSIRDSIRIRILTPDSTRDSIRMQTADSQVPNQSWINRLHFLSSAVWLYTATECTVYCACGNIFHVCD